MNSIEDYKNFLKIEHKSDSKYGPHTYSELDITLISDHNQISALFSENLDLEEVIDDFKFIENSPYNKEKIINLEKIKTIVNTSFERNIKILDKRGISISEINEPLDKLNEIYDELIKSIKEMNNRVSIFKLYSTSLASLDEEEKTSLLNKISYPKDIDFEKRPHIVYNSYRNQIKNIENIILDKITAYFESENTIDAFKFKKIIESNTDNNTLKEFLKTKVITEQIEAEFNFTQSQDFYKLFIFKDNSALVQGKNEVYNVIMNNIQMTDILDNLHVNLLSYTLRKKPKLFNILNDKIKDELSGRFNVNLITTFLENVNMYINNEQVLKNNKFNIQDISNMSVEKFGDNMSAVITKHKINQYRRSIISNKYEHFLNENNYNDFKMLYENNVTKEDLQKYIGKKIASCKEQEQFDSMIKDLIKIVNSFEYSIVMSNLANYDIKPFYDEEGVIAFEVKQYEECKKFGSPSWCIQRSESTFLTYKQDCHQIIIYDFNKELNDNKSMIGYTIYEDGKQRTQHLKDDSYFEIKNNELVDSIYIQSLNKVVSSSLISSDLKGLIKNKNKTKNKIGVE